MVSTKVVCFSLLFLTLPLAFTFSFVERAQAISTERSETGPQAAGKSGMRGRTVTPTSPVAAAPSEQAKAFSAITVSKDNRLSANINNRPLDEVLRMMMEKRFFEIKGSLPSGEPVTVNFADLTLDEAIKKLLRGYNYVLISQGPAQAPLLMVMGRTQRGNLTYERAILPAPSEQPSSPIGAVQKDSGMVQLPADAATITGGQLSASPQAVLTQPAPVAVGGGSAQKVGGNMPVAAEAARQPTQPSTQTSVSAPVNSNYLPGGPGFQPGVPGSTPSPLGSVGAGGH